MSKLQSHLELFSKSIVALGSSINYMVQPLIVPQSWCFGGRVIIKCSKVLSHFLRSKAESFIWQFYSDNWKKNNVFLKINFYIFKGNFLFLIWPAFNGPSISTVKSVRYFLSYGHLMSHIMKFWSKYLIDQKNETCTQFFFPFFSCCKHVFENLQLRSSEFCKKM